MRSREGSEGILRKKNQKREILKREELLGDPMKGCREQRRQDGGTKVKRYHREKKEGDKKLRRDEKSRSIAGRHEFQRSGLD